MSIHETQYRLTLLGDGLQGLGLSLSVHHTGQDQGITELHALRLAHLVEVCGHFASHLADRLEDQIADAGKAEGKE